jgi:hypothetical protein
MTSTAKDGAASVAAANSGENVAAIRTFHLHGNIKSSTPAQAI